MGDHSIYAPSSMDKILKCQGFVQSVAIAEEPAETEEQREGTASHWVGSEMLSHNYIDEATFIGETAPNGVIINDDMYDCALLYYNKVTEITSKYPDCKLHIEETVYMPQINKMCFGTPDAWLFVLQTLTLHVFDYKYGHKEVDAFENAQLLSYDVGVLNQAGVAANDPLGNNGLSIINHVIQPRFYGGDSHRIHHFESVELRTHVNKMEAACAASQLPNPVCTTGEHCTGCAAMYVCKASLEANAAAIEYSRTMVKLDLSDIALGYELRLLETSMELLKQRKASLATIAETKMREGGRVMGYGMVQGRSTRKWIAKPDEVIAMGSVLGVELKAPVTALTPPAAEKLLLRKGIDKSVIEGMYETPATSMKLKYDNGNKAKQMFSQEKL